MNKAEAISNAVMSTKLNQGRREGLEQGLKQGMKKGMKKGMRQGIKQGKEEGREEGRELEKIDFVRSMLKDELPLEMISKYSKLSIERLEELKKENE